MNLLELVLWSVAVSVAFGSAVGGYRLFGIAGGVGGGVLGLLLGLTAAIQAAKFLFALGLVGKKSVTRPENRR